MRPINPIKLTLDDIEKELKNIKLCITETSEFLNKKLSPEKIKELKELKENLELLKSFGKEEQKQKYLKLLENREKNFEKVIINMKKNNKAIYNPIKGEDWIDV